MHAARVSRNARPRTVVPWVLCLVIGAGVAGLVAQTRAKTLDIYFIDTEGGQSTLYVGPTGESLLVDSGNAGDRDLGRILEVLTGAGVRQIDHLWSTHYHGDHVGALVALAAQVPIGHFYDHGTPHPTDRVVSKPFLSSYEELSRGKRTTVKPGDTVRMRRRISSGSPPSRTARSSSPTPATGFRKPTDRASDENGGRGALS